MVGDLQDAAKWIQSTYGTDNMQINNLYIRTHSTQGNPGDKDGVVSPNSGGLSVHNSDNTQTANINAKALVNYDPKSEGFLSKQIGALATIFQSLGGESIVGFAACGLAYHSDFTKAITAFAAQNGATNVTAWTGFNPGIPTGNDKNNNNIKYMKVGMDLLEETEARPLQGIRVGNLNAKSGYSEGTLKTNMKLGNLSGNFEADVKTTTPVGGTGATPINNGNN